MDTDRAMRLTLTAPSPALSPASPVGARQSACHCEQAPGLSHPSASLSTASPVEPQTDALVWPMPGRELASWTEPLLGLLFQDLTLVDLLSCSRVCRRWHRVASAPELVARYFIRSYPAQLRRPLLQALDNNRAHQHLALWSKHLAQSASLCEAPQWPAERTHALPTLFYCLTEQRVQADRFATPAPLRIGDQAWAVQAWTCSPDSNLLAIAASLEPGLESDGWTMNVRLWQQETTGFREVGNFQHAATSLSCLTFSADSRKLHLVDSRGGQQTWVCQPDTANPHWQSTGTTALCNSRIRCAAFSPDGRYLALSISNEVRIYTATDAGTWQQQGLCPLPEPSEDLPAPARYAPEQLLFAEKAQHLVIASPYRIWACHREGVHWREQPVKAGNAGGYCDPDKMGVTVTLDADERYLAVAFRRGEVSEEAHAQITLGLWRFEQGTGWLPVMRRHFEVPNRPEDPFPMRFSPDGHQLAFPALAFPARPNEKYKCFLSPVARHVSNLDKPWRWALVPDPPEQNATDQAVGLAMPCSPWSKPSIPAPFRVCAVGALTFSATGACLAATMGAGVQIWQRNAARHWIPILWTGRVDESRVTGKLAFSPDGYHCALAVGVKGEVSVWGPGRDGQYTRKMHSTQDGRVNQMQFTADGAQVLVSCSIPGQYSRHVEGVDDTDSFCIPAAQNLRCLALAPADVQAGQQEH